MSRRLVPVAARIALAVSPHRRTLWTFFASMGALVGLFWYGGRVELVFLGLAPVGTVVLAVLLADVCVDFRRGHAVFWMQRAVSPVRFYLARFAETAAVGAGLAMLWIGALSGVAVLADWGLESHPMLEAPWMVAVVLMIVAVGFGLSAWLPGGARMALVAFGAISVAGAVLAELRPGLEERFATRVVLEMLFPLEDVNATIRWVRGDEGGSPGALLRIAIYAGAWTALGALGVRRAASSGRMAGAGR